MVGNLLEEIAIVLTEEGNYKKLNNAILSRASSKFSCLGFLISKEIDGNLTVVRGNVRITMDSVLWLVTIVH